MPVIMYFPYFYNENIIEYMTLAFMDIHPISHHVRFDTESFYKVARYESKFITKEACSPRFAVFGCLEH